MLVLHSCTFDVLELGFDQEQDMHAFLVANILSASPLSCVSQLIDRGKTAYVQAIGRCFAEEKIVVRYLKTIRYPSNETCGATTLTLMLPEVLRLEMTSKQYQSKETLYAVGLSGSVT
jgi:hypothetical protein